MISDKSFNGKRGVDLLSDPALNKSTGFTESEREKLGLVGLVPDVTESDPLYLGLRQSRPKTEELYAFVDEFVDAVQEVFPLCCIHFEDWTGTDAINLLARYRERVCCYNDDIQGTAGIALAGIVSALKVTGGQLKEQRIMFLGAGSAGIGIANLLVTAMKLEGLSLQDAQAQISLFDVNGLLEPGRKDLSDAQRPYAHPHEPTKDFVTALKSLKPNVIIGVSTVGKAFNQQVVEAMSQINERPIIFALSNPTDRAECSAQEAYKWSKGKALYAAGVQFPPVQYDGQPLLPGQANNSYVFPAVGMAIYATQAQRVTDEMFTEAARGISDQVTPDELKQGLLFPPQSNILEIELKTAARVAKVVFDSNLARVERPADMEAFIRSHVYKPEYRSLV